MQVLRSAMLIPVNFFFYRNQFSYSPMPIQRQRPEAAMVPAQWLRLEEEARLDQLRNLGVRRQTWNGTDVGVYAYMTDAGYRTDSAHST